MTEYPFPDIGHTVSVDDKYKLNKNIAQFGIPEGSILEVKDIRRDPATINFYFSCTFPDDKEPTMDWDGNPVIFMKHHLKTFIETGDLERVE